MSESSSTSGVFDLDRIRNLVELMKEHGLTELDLQEKEQKIRLSRETKTVAAAPMQYAPAPVASAAAPPAAASGGAVDGPHIKVISSPMIGSFYTRPNPKAEPFVKVGDQVNAETVVCVIEAMKVFNEIPAEISGKVVAVLVEDEDPVDFGRPLFKIDTSK